MIRVSVRSINVGRLYNTLLLHCGVVRLRRPRIDMLLGPPHNLTNTNNSPESCPKLIAAYK